MNRINLVGYLAATLTTAAFLPQAWHILRTRETGGISLAMYVTFSIGVALWTAYGLATQDWPILFANGVTLVLALTILGMKIRYGQVGTERKTTPGNL